MVADRVGVSGGGSEGDEGGKGVGEVSVASREDCVDGFGERNVHEGLQSLVRGPGVESVPVDGAVHEEPDGVGRCVRLQARTARNARDSRKRDGNVLDNGVKGARCVENELVEKGGRDEES